MSNNDGSMNSSGKREDKGKAPLQEPTTNTTPNSHVDVVIERKITVNVFFDGTGNNRHNTEARLADKEYENLLAGNDQATLDWKRIKELEAGIKREDAWRKNYPDRPPQMKNYDYERNKHLIEQYKEEYAEAGYDQPNYQPHTHLSNETSYTNEFSNVALLFLEASDESAPKIYIEGAGTSKHAADDTKGLAFAAGKTSGVEARVNKAFTELIEIVKDERATELILNVFGFSRGAFYGRVFCAMAKRDDERHPEGYAMRDDYAYPARNELKIAAKDITINFVGIYDTVSSHGGNHYNNPGTFPLDIGKEREGIKKIVHLTAQNDYRDHFPLTSVTKALDEGIAFECGLPGAHSNLGGGYTDEWLEENHYLSYEHHNHVKREDRRSGEIHWRWWEEMGYYKRSELTRISPSARALDFVNPKKTPDFKVQDFHYIHAKRTVRHHYQYISLKAMRLSAEEFGQLKFTIGDRRYTERMEAFSKQKKEEKDQLLSKMDQEVTTFIEANYGKSGQFRLDIEQALGTKEASKQFYHTYINNSLQPIYKTEIRDSQGNLVMPSFANEGTWRNQDDAGTPQRPVVDGG